MTHITCRLTAKNRDRLRNPTLGNRVGLPLPFLRVVPLWAYLMPINAGEVVEISLVGHAAMTHENLVVDDRGQRKPAEYVAIQSYQFRRVVLCDTHHIGVISECKLETVAILIESNYSNTAQSVLGNEWLIYCGANF